MEIQGPILPAFLDKPRSLTDSQTLQVTLMTRFSRFLFLGAGVLAGMLVPVSTVRSANPIRQAVPARTAHIALDEGLAQTPNAGVISRLMEAAGFFQVLAGKGSTWTVLVPKDASFPQGLESCLLQHPDFMKPWVGRHVFQARLAPSLPFRGQLPLKSIGGEAVFLTDDGDAARFDGVVVRRDPARFENGNLLFVDQPLDLDQLGPCQPVLLPAIP